MRKTPPVPAQLPFTPNDVTPATTFESARKLGPPESPKQVPPVFLLFDSRSEKSPVKPGVLIWMRRGWVLRDVHLDEPRVRDHPDPVGLVLPRGCIGNDCWSP